MRNTSDGKRKNIVYMFTSEPPMNHPATAPSTVPSVTITSANFR